MKRIIFIVCILFSLFSKANENTDTIPIVNRSNAALIVRDARVYPLYNSYLPNYTDTTAANNPIAIGNDYIGAKIYTTSDNIEWVRKFNGFSNYWAAEGSGSAIASQCGLQQNGGVVTYDDSTLNFDVSAANYTLCCDNISRTSPFTHITLDSNTADNPRYDAIILTATGVAVLKGTPDPNPQIPQLNSCQILLSYVLINAHENIPANFTITPIIYDEGVGTGGGEWDTLATGLSASFKDVAAPIHLTHDISTGALAVGNTLTFTDTGNIQLSDYSLLKFYIRLKTPYATGGTIFSLTWFLDNVQVSLPLAVNIGIFGMGNTAGVYYTLAIPIPSWQLLSLTANRLVINFQKVNSSGVYIDWIQLQRGAIQSGGSGLTFFSMGDADSLLHTTVQTATTTPNVTFSKYTVPANTVLINNSNIPDVFHWGKIDLSSNLFINTFSTTNIAPGADGTYLGTNTGVVEWTPFTNDTTFIKAPLLRTVNGINNNDTLSLPITIGATTDSALMLNRGTGFLEMRKVTGAQNWESTLNLQFTPFVASHVVDLGNNPFELVNGNHINFTVATGTSTESDVNIYSGFVGLGNFSGGNLTNIQIDDVAQQTTITSDSILLKSTLAGANSGYVWTLKDPTTGSGYWAVVGGGTFPTLQQVFNTEVGGSVLTKLDSIIGGNFGLRIFGSNTFFSTPAVLINASASGGLALSVTAPNFGIVATVTSGGQAIFGSASSGQGVEGVSVSSDGVLGISTNGYGLHAQSNSSSTNTVSPVLAVQRSTTGTAANGIGGAIDFFTQQTNGIGAISNQIISKWTDATNATRTSQFIITGVNSGTTANKLVINGNGTMQFSAYTTSAFTGTAVNNIQSDASGNIIQGSLSAGIKASADLTAQTAGVSSIATFTPSADGTFRIGAYINITAIVTNVITLKVTYTDENSNAVTQIIPLTLAATGAVGTTATIVGNNSATDIQIRCKSGSAITVLTTATGVGSETYDVGATIEQLR